MTPIWGISAGLPEQFTQLPGKLPPNFRSLEVPGDALDSAAGCDKINRYLSSGVAVSGYDLLPPELARLIPEESRSIQNEFDFQFRSRCRRAAQLGIREFSLAFDLTRIGNPQFAARFRTLLRRCSGVLEEYHLRLRFPCRIPTAPGSASAEEQLSFIRSLLYPGFGVVVEFHPHEPHPAGEPERSLRSLLFADEYRRIRFEPQNGNQLTSAALDLCERSFTPDTVAGTVLFFSPGHGVIDDLMLEHFNRLIQNRNKE